MVFSFVVSVNIFALFCLTPSLAHAHTQVAMGQGQADVAMQLVRECARNGHWLCLKNLHLVTSWLSILEKVCAVLLLSTCGHAYNG